MCRTAPSFLIAPFSLSPCAEHENSNEWFKNCTYGALVLLFESWVRLGAMAVLCTLCPPPHHPACVHAVDKLIHYVNLDGRVNVFYSTPAIFAQQLLASNYTWSNNVRLDVVVMPLLYYPLNPLCAQPS
jgi:hypothetical protein